MHPAGLPLLNLEKSPAGQAPRASSDLGSVAADETRGFHRLRGLEMRAKRWLAGFGLPPIRAKRWLAGFRLLPIRAKRWLAGFRLLLIRGELRDAAHVRDQHL